MTWQPHQERVIQEKKDLDEKIEKLGAFFPTELCQSLPFNERSRLSRQITVMKEYSSILGERIADFTQGGRQ